jgi:uncharacterized membrane protein YgcG
VIGAAAGVKPVIEVAAGAMASSIEDALVSLLHDNPAGLAVAVAVVAVLLLLVMRAAAPGKPAAWLDPATFKPLPLARVDQLTHNTRRFVFRLPDPRMRVGLPTGQHITFLAKDADGKDVYRPYTPVTDDDTPGAVEVRRGGGGGGPPGGGGGRGGRGGGAAGRRWGSGGRRRCSRAGSARGGWAPADGAAPWQQA